MTKEELMKFSDQEIQWLRYYSTKKSRAELVDVKNLYEDLVRMGYSKRQMPLYTRCAAAMLTSDKDINSNTDVSDVYIVPRERNVDINIFTSLEVLIVLYTDEQESVLEKLKK